MKTINFKELYNQIMSQDYGTQKRIPIETSIGVFLGFSHTGDLRLSFLSTKKQPKIESTKALQVIQSKENETTYWTSFELLDKNAVNEYFVFCENMIEAIYRIEDEQTAFVKLKNRYLVWKALFQKTNSNLSRNIIQGLIGELYYLYNYIIPEYGIEKAILSWGGPDAQEKDFTINNTWYEVKTIGSMVDRVHISSIAQLDSDVDGHLIIVRTEAVSSEYTGNSYNILDLINKICELIPNSDIISVFTKKIEKLGVSIDSCSKCCNFNIISVDLYKVTNIFPRICRKDIKYPEVVGITYDLSLSSIYQYKEN